ncbi:MarR family winged helix-turn-helix transcriptional regulator [Actinoplanes sp. CA-252034]|uniref:MarR family winged helix-turn-helix transcriptional regulator n=1 Tax=Actinoplanes sp. CA-252034 TaxID=3239906 RepID=UPI003D9740AD
MTPRSRSGGDPAPTLLLWEIQQTARVAARHFERAVQGAGISTAEFGVLACANDEPGITQAEMARQLHIRPQALTAPIDKLQRRGLLEGTASGRGRKSRLTITVAGRGALDAAWPAIIALNAPGNLDMTEQTARALATRLDRLRRHLTGAPGPAHRDGSS